MGSFPTFDKLVGDPGYVSLVEEGAAHASGEPVDDGLLQLIHTDPETAEIEAQYAVLAIRATLAPGGSVKGVELGVETAQQASKITGCPTSFGMSVRDPTGRSSGSASTPPSPTSRALGHHCGRPQLQPEGRQGAQQGLPAGRDDPDGLPPHRLTVVRWRVTEPTNPPPDPAGSGGPRALRVVPIASHNGEMRRHRSSRFHRVAGLVGELLTKDHEVVGIDNFLRSAHSTGVPPRYRTPLAMASSSSST